MNLKEFVAVLIALLLAFSFGFTLDHFTTWTGPKGPFGGAIAEPGFSVETQAFLSKGTCTADSFLAPGLEADKACDGSTGTTWLSGGGYPHWLIVEFGASAIVSNASIVWGNYPPTTFRLDVWDGSGFLTRGNFTCTIGGCGSQNFTYSLDSQTTSDRLRVYGNSTGAGSDPSLMGIVEIWPQGVSSNGIVTVPASDVNKDVALLHGELTVKGGEPAEFVFLYFEWGPTVNLGFTITIGWTDVAVVFSSNLSGLDSATLYYFRASVDGNSTGTQVGDTLSFTTAGRRELSSVETLIPWLVLALFAISLTVGLLRSSVFLLFAGFLALVLAAVVDAILLSDQTDFIRYVTFLTLIATAIVLFVRGVLDLPREVGKA